MRKLADFSFPSSFAAAIAAAKAYADALIVAMIRDCGNWDATSGAFPTTGGTGVAGAIKQGNAWRVSGLSGAGALGGITVNNGDWFRALVDAPGQTATNWAITENNLGYTPADIANISTNVETDKASTVKFPNVKALYDWATSKFARVVSGSLVLSSAEGIGIKVDELAPDYGYEDLKGLRSYAGTGATAPSRLQFKAGVFAAAYTTGDTVDWDYHITHEDVRGGDKHQHLHIKMSEGTVASGANLIITTVTGHFFHNRLGSPAPITKTFTITPAELNACAGGTTVKELLAAQAGGGAGLLNSNDWLVDDDLTTTCTFTQLPTLTGGLHQRLGFSHCDFHRKVRFGGTKFRDTVSGNGGFDGTT